jgi:hypothetical protein
MNDEVRTILLHFIVHRSSFIVSLSPLLFVAARATFPIKSRSLFLTQKGAHERG